MTSEKQHIILEAQDLAIGYFHKKRSISIAKNLNFQFEEGSLVSLVGANGIGKSTLLRTLAGMQPKLSGEIKLLQKELSKHHSVELATVLSIVLTDPPSSKNLTVLELVSLGRQPHTNWMGTLSEKDTQTIQWALKNTDTLDLINRKCFELSDGQMQRVAIARALAQDTPLIVLDEPTTHLDLFHRAYVLKLLKKLANETKKTILFSTHEIDLAIQLSDQMIVMTPENAIMDTPSALIKNGAFDVLFPKETIVFDKSTGRFVMK